MAWVLSYVQKEVAKAQKDNLLDELSKGESEMKTAEELFSKIRNKFGETTKKERKVEQLRTIEQEGRIYDKYIQEFKKIIRGSRYKRQFFIEKFKRGLSKGIRRKLAEVESPLYTIKEQQKKAVKLNQNQRQSRVEERMLKRNIACLSRNAQQRGEFSGELYRKKRGQII